MATQEMKTVYERHTDVMHVIVCEPLAGARIATIDIGDQVGFPGLITARVDMDSDTVYGLNIDNYTAFKHTVHWQKRMLSIRKALELIVSLLRVDMSIKNKHNHRPMYA